MVARKAFHDLGFKMGDGVVAFWKYAHRTEPVVVYSVALGFAGASSPPPLPRDPPTTSQALPLPRWQRPRRTGHSRRAQSTE